MDYNKKYNDDDNKGLKIAWYRELESGRRLARASWMDSVKGRRHHLTSAQKRILWSGNPARERPHQIALVEKADLNRLYEEIDVLEQQRSWRARCSVRKVVNEKKDLRTHSARDPESEPAKRGKAVALLNPTNDVLGEEVVQVELDLYSRNDLYGIHDEVDRLAKANQLHELEDENGDDRERNFRLFQEMERMRYLRSISHH